MTKSLLAVSLCLFLAVVPLVACSDRLPQVIALQPAGEVARPGSMTVTGSATLEISPDCADVTMTISAEEVLPGAATRSMTAKQAAVAAVLAKLGVARADIKLSYLTMNPLYERNLDGSYSERVRGYRAETVLTATTRAFEKIGDMMDAGAAGGATHLATAFRRSDLPELKKKVREMALAAASAKARQAADALGIKVGRIVSVAETQAGAMWGNPYGQVANNVEVRVITGQGLGGALQPLSLDITIGYELGGAPA